MASNDSVSDAEYNAYRTAYKAFRALECELGVALLATRAAQGRGSPVMNHSRSRYVLNPDGRHAVQNGTEVQVYWMQEVYGKCAWFVTVLRVKKGVVWGTIFHGRVGTGSPTK